jgi:hypothetical protein
LASFAHRKRAAGNKVILNIRQNERIQLRRKDCALAPCPTSSNSVPATQFRAHFRSRSRDSYVTM